MAYTQEQINQALSSLLESDPNASQQDVINAAAAYGILPDQVASAYSAYNAPSAAQDSAAASPLAQAEPVDETPSWQEQLRSSPLSLSPNTVCVEGIQQLGASPYLNEFGLRVDPIYTACTGRLTVCGDNWEYAPVLEGYRSQLSNPFYEDGTYGQYIGTYDASGKLQDIDFQQVDRSGGWLNDALIKYGPAIITAMAGPLAPAVAVARGVAEGQSLTCIAKNMAINYAIGQAVPNIAGCVATATGSCIIGRAAQGALQGATKGAVTGQDIGESAISGATGSLASNVLGNIGATVDKAADDVTGIFKDLTGGLRCAANVSDDLDDSLFGDIEIDPDTGEVSSTISGCSPLGSVYGADTGADCDVGVGSTFTGSPYGADTGSDEDAVAGGVFTGSPYGADTGSDCDTDRVADFTGTPYGADTGSDEDETVATDFTGKPYGADTGSDEDEVVQSCFTCSPYGADTGSNCDYNPCGNVYTDCIVCVCVCEDCCVDCCDYTDCCDGCDDNNCDECCDGCDDNNCDECTDCCECCECCECCDTDGKIKIPSPKLPKTPKPVTPTTPSSTPSGKGSGIPWLCGASGAFVNRGPYIANPLGMATLQQLPLAEGGLALAGGGSSKTVESIAKELTPEFPECKVPEVFRSSSSSRSAPETHSKLKQIMSHISPLGNMGGMAGGGLPKKYQQAEPDGHDTEFVTGLTGYYADGGGTGQSDDIPAMLHDGDYVMDAETVSALGDGSSKAGRKVLDGFRTQVPHDERSTGKVVPAKIADGEYVFPEAFVTALGRGDNKRGAEILDGLREKLRAHKRAAPIDKIPPKAKSPLAYIGKMKG